MKELTQVVTVQITDIAKLTDEQLTKIRTLANRKEVVEKTIDELLGCDNVNVLKIQDFVREVDANEN